MAETSNEHPSATPGERSGKDKKVKKAQGKEKTKNKKKSGSPPPPIPRLGKFTDRYYPSALLEDLANGSRPESGNGKLDRKYYEKELSSLQEELVKMQYWVKATGFRLMVLFEGRDAAGKGARSSASPNR